jgi:acetylornithine deacetylase/succinyl-diaminopimelate desuccinylase-like protein
MRTLVWVLFCSSAFTQDNTTLRDRAQRYLVDLIKLDTTNPPGNETKGANYLRLAAATNGIPCELLGKDPARLNFIARLPARVGSTQRPLLLMAHSDVVPADRAQWAVPPFTALLKSGYIYGRGSQDDKSLLAAELAVLVELKKQAVSLDRDVILLSEADEESGSAGMTWILQNAYSKIAAEFALNEGGAALDSREGVRIFQIQTAEKVPTRVVLTAKGTAGHGSLPRSDNPIVHLSRAIVRLADADQPVKLNATTRRYFSDLSKLQDYDWLKPMLGKLEDPNMATSAANQIREHDPELNAMLRTSLSPTILNAGMKINVIPNTAVAEIDVRRLPNETREEVETRFRRAIADSSVEIAREQGQDMPSTEPSSQTTALYKAMEQVFTHSASKALVVPYMSRGATDGSFLRAKGMAVYGVPVFLREGGESRAHGNDERISPENLGRGTELLWRIILAVAGNDRMRAQ